MHCCSHHQLTKLRHLAGYRYRLLPQLSHDSASPRWGWPDHISASCACRRSWAHQLWSTCTWTSQHALSSADTAGARCCWACTASWRGGRWGSGGPCCSSRAPRPPAPRCCTWPACSAPPTCPATGDHTSARSLTTVCVSAHLGQNLCIPCCWRRCGLAPLPCCSARSAAQSGASVNPRTQCERPGAVQGHGARGPCLVVHRPGACSVLGVRQHGRGSVPRQHAGRAGCGAPAGADHRAGRDRVRVGWVLRLPAVDPGGLQVRSTVHVVILHAAGMHAA